MWSETKPLAVLVAEDSPFDQQVISLAFEQNGLTHPIRLVGSGEEAIAYMSGTGKYADRACYPFPSFILTDLNMTNGDGFSLLQFLKRTPEFAAIPALVLSGSSEPEDIRRAYLLGANAYLVKPALFRDWQNFMKVILDFCSQCEVLAPPGTSITTVAPSRSSVQGCRHEGNPSAPQ